MSFSSVCSKLAQWAESHLGSYLLGSPLSFFVDKYIHPADAVKLGQAELVVIDEAAAIPLPLVKNLLGPYLVFMASTING